MTRDAKEKPCGKSRAIFPRGLFTVSLDGLSEGGTTRRGRGGEREPVPATLFSRVKVHLIRGLRKRLRILQIMESKLKKSRLTPEEYCNSFPNQCKDFHPSTTTLFWKAVYRLDMYCGNPRDGYYFHQQNNDKRIKVNEDQDFLWWL